MHIHTGEEERQFNLADIDSINFVDLELGISVEPEEIDFGEVPIGNIQNEILTVTNTGIRELIVSAIDLEEGVFSVLFEDTIFIAPEQSFNFTVSFSPQEIRDYDSEMVIHSNSQVDPEISIPLSGSGLEEVIWEYDQTDHNMSILVQSAEINEESLVEGDLVGVFTPDELCAGYGRVSEDFHEGGMGISAWGANEGMDNGFQVGEQLNFRFWDDDARQEVFAEIEEIIAGEQVYVMNGLLVARLSAIRE